MTQSVLQYTTREGDRWDLIAHQYYGDALLIGGLLAANPHLAMAEQFAAGLVVRVPVLTAKPQSAQADMPPWMRGSAS